MLSNIMFTNNNNKYLQMSKNDNEFEHILTNVNVLTNIIKC